MDTAAIQWIISIILGIIPWIFPNLPWYGKVIFSLVIALLSLAISWFQLNQKLKEARRNEQELDTRHTALANQFDQKNLVLRRFQHLTEMMETFLQIALLNEDKAKIDLIYQAYLKAKRELIDGGENDDQ